MWTVYNEIDECVYDGTPLFESQDEALESDWFQRPSSVLILVTINKPF